MILNFIVKKNKRGVIPFFYWELIYLFVNEIMGDISINSLIFTIGGTIITALGILVFRLYEKLSSNNETEFSKLLLRVDKTNEILTEALDDVKIVIYEIQRKLSMTEVRTENFTESCSKIHTSIDKRLEEYGRILTDHDLKIKIMETKK